mmetsp:Transcript_25929/g.86353  ORF Transcript_25929/g.86353 Transcript_25929/m.86353 type:complete len:318 (-) Transcript_25929:54-1007(-)
MAPLMLLATPALVSASAAAWPSPLPPAPLRLGLRGARGLLRAPALQGGAVTSGARSRVGTATSVAASVLAAGGAAAGRRRRAWVPGRLGGAASAEGDSSKSSAASSESPGAGDDAGGEGGSSGNPLDGLFEKWKKLPVETKEDLQTFLTSLTVALAFRAFFVEPRFIPSLSMYPTFDVGDQLTVDKISKRWRDLQRRDVVVFTPPQAFNEVVGEDGSGEALIKRIVALEGDTVEVKNRGQLYINGEVQDEPFTNENARYRFGPVTVPKGCVFVLGDNRNESLDGHVWGFLPKENIIGRATLKFWPPWRIGVVQAAPP